MFELTVEREFCAAHAITMAGQREQTHGHNWRVRIGVAGDKLDADGLLCDFHLVERALDSVVGRLHNRNLNDTPPFDRLNPTAEQVARYIAESVSTALPRSIAVAHASVTEAPGCTAIFRVS